MWQATDTTLDRQVALKLLPVAFTADPERLARFEREAKILAALNHPHIAAIHGLHESEGSAGSEPASVQVWMDTTIPGTACRSSRAGRSRSRTVSHVQRD